ncbi:MAG: hypothetical protein LBS70_01900, partial [Candidatus Accumulibacter sp.]|nr:hypothetical protein [Accumulibacter sp.]
MSSALSVVENQSRFHPPRRAFFAATPGGPVLSFDFYALTVSFMLGSDAENGAGLDAVAGDLPF